MVLGHGTGEDVVDLSTHLDQGLCHSFADL
jgi:hypothetical protein